MNGTRRSAATTATAAHPIANLRCDGRSRSTTSRVPPGRGGYAAAAMSDDWRIRIDVEEEHGHGLLDRLGLDLSSEARELAEELEGRRLVVSRDDETIFVYAGSREEAERASAIVEAELREAGAPGTVTEPE